MVLILFDKIKNCMIYVIEHEIIFYFKDISYKFINKMAASFCNKLLDESNRRTWDPVPPEWNYYRILRHTETRDSSTTLLKVWKEFFNLPSKETKTYGEMHIHETSEIPRTNYVSRCILVAKKMGYRLSNIVHYSVIHQRFVLAVNENRSIKYGVIVQILYYPGLIFF